MQAGADAAITQYFYNADAYFAFMVQIRKLGLDVPVIVGGTLRLPQRSDDGYDSAFTVPARLHAAGVRDCLCGAGRMGYVRNLPYQAGGAGGCAVPSERGQQAARRARAEVLGGGGRVGFRGRLWGY